MPSHRATDIKAWEFRHPFLVRLTHWINALCILILTISGFQIYTGRQWFALGRWHHFFFAWIFSLNGLLFVSYSLLSGHLIRDLLPGSLDRPKAGAPLRSYFLFCKLKETNAARYNVLQKIFYSGVILGLGPLILMTGLISSARGEALFPLLLNVFGSRRTAKAIHFDVMILFIGFTFLHLFMLAMTGFRRQVRSMITGWRRIEPAAKENENP